MDKLSVRKHNLLRKIMDVDVTYADLTSQQKDTFRYLENMGYVEPLDASIVQSYYKDPLMLTQKGVEAFNLSNKAWTEEAGKIQRRLYDILRALVLENRNVLGLYSWNDIFRAAKLDLSVEEKLDLVQRLNSLGYVTYTTTGALRASGAGVKEYKRRFENGN